MLFILLFYCINIKVFFYLRGRLFFPTIIDLRKHKLQPINRRDAFSLLRRIALISQSFGSVFLEKWCVLHLSYPYPINRWYKYQLIQFDCLFRWMMGVQPLQIENLDLSLRLVFGVERLSCFEHDVKGNSQRPYIYFLAIVFLFLDDLGSYIGGWATEGLHHGIWYCVLFGKTEIDEFWVHMRIKQHIFWLDIPMRNSLEMQVFNCRIQLQEYPGCHFLIQRPIALNIVEKFPIFAELHEDIYFVITLDNVVDTCDVLVEDLLADLCLIFDCFVVGIVEREDLHSVFLSRW